MIPFVDAHHHVWDPIANPHPWLAPDAAIPFRYGDYSAIKKPYSFADHAAAARGQNLVASVTMEGEWDPRRPLDEARWLHGLDKPGRLGCAHVSQAWLDSPDVGEILSTLAAIPSVRGVRQKPVLGTGGARPSSFADPAFRRGYGLLADHGLRFDLQVPYGALDEARDLAERHPGVPIVLDHAGLPADRSPQGLSEWRESLRRFAQVPHAFVKISGIGLKGRPWRVADNRDVVLRTIDAFGPYRCMFASNFPVDGLCGTFDTIVEGYREIVSGFPESEQRALFHDVAIAFYDLAIP